MQPALLPVLTAILRDYSLPLGGTHGVAHWARVLENGLRLAEVSGANVEVVSLFAVLHDSRRLNETTDPENGLRAAEFATELRDSLIDLDDHEFRLLYRACEGHTHERDHPDVTIQTCWDSDRLDLGRVGITPHRTAFAPNSPNGLKRSSGPMSERASATFPALCWTYGGSTW